MKARVISYTLANCQATEDILNEWLEEVGEISIDRCVPLGNAGPDRDCGAVIILYRKIDDEVPEIDQDPVLVGSPGNSTCSQCKKRPAIEGIKMCEQCREYQRKYRERQKSEKKKSMYP